MAKGTRMSKGTRMAKDSPLVEIGNVINLVRVQLYLLYSNGIQTITSNPIPAVMVNVHKVLIVEGVIFPWCLIIFFLVIGGK
jgi:hypothetical protein